MLPRYLALAALYVAALALGAASAWWTLTRVAAFGEASGPWRASLLAGSPDADAYTRARVALGGLLALSREETLYYVAATDSTGAPLKSRCRYRVVGTPPPTRWWSITAYADDVFLFADDARRYSLASGRAVLDAQGRFALVTAPAPPPRETTADAPWLPTPGDRGLLLTLRLYHPDATLAASPQRLAAPRIERLGDCA
jgi:hypothetical protein